MKKYKKNDEHNKCVRILMDFCIYIYVLVLLDCLQFNLCKLSLPVGWAFFISGDFICSFGIVERG